MTTAYLLDASIVAEMARWHWHGNNTSNNHRGKVLLYNIIVIFKFESMKTTFKSSFLPLLRSLQIFRQWSKCNSMQCQTRNTTSWWLYSFYPVLIWCVHNIIFAPYISTFSWFPPPNSAIFSLFRASSAWQCCWLPSPHHSHSLHSLYAWCWAGMGSALSLQNKYCAECNQKRFCFKANLDNARTDCEQLKINVLIPEGKVAKVDQKYNSD